MHELMFQAGMNQRNERAKRAHSLYYLHSVSMYCGEHSTCS